MDDLGEHGVVAVEVRLLGVGDEELAPVGVGPAVRHRHHPAGVVLERLPDLVGELLPPGRGDVAVEDGAVVVAARAQRQEVLRRPRRLVAEHLALDVPEIRVQRHRLRRRSIGPPVSHREEIFR